MLKRFCAVVLPLLLLGAGSSDPRRIFTVRDSIEMTHFLGTNCAAPNVVFSPDNRYFAVVTYRGIIRSNTIASTISVFSTANVQAYLRGGKTPQPRVIARIDAVPRTDSDCSYEPTIFALQWLPNSRGVLFTAEGAAANERRLYEADLASGSMHAVSREGYDVTKFVAAGDSIVYEAVPPKTMHLAGKRINPDAVDITGEDLTTVLFPTDQDDVSFSTLWIARNGTNRRITGNSSPPLQLFNVSEADEVFSVSPSGNTLVVLLPVTQIPPSWTAFEPNPRDPQFRLKPGNLAATAPLDRPRSYTLIDLETGKTHALIQAPEGESLGSWEFKGAVWSPSGKKLLVMDTFLPLQGIGAAERAQRLYPCWVAVMNVRGSQIQCLASDRYTYGAKDLMVLSGAFGRSDDDIVLRMENADEQTFTDERYHFKNGAWSLVRATAGSANGPPPSSESLAVTIRQNLNVPPTLWATDLHRGITQKLWDPNPQLTHMQLGDASIIRWKDSSGFAWEAVLVKPPGYVRAKRYPLVIQTHGVDLNDFITDGTFTTAFAARELAGAGIMVLQMSWNYEHWRSSQEAPDDLLGFQSAIARLDAMGLIDPKRVGAIGFSRSAYHVEYALVADPQLFAAASITDGVDYSYMQYLLEGADKSGFALGYEQVYGTSPFGKGLAVWTKNAPDFQLDRVHAPLLIGAIGPESILEEWEIYASLRMQKKPVDLMYIADGQHILQKPLDRLASQQMNVDWFRFWLQGYEDPNPAKAAQYKRWETWRKP